MKVIETLKKILIGIFAAIFFAFALTMTILLLYRNDFGVTQMGDTSWILIDDEIASINYKKGDLVLVDAVKLTQIAEGDEIFAYTVDEENIAHVSLGTVGKTYEDEKAIAYENGSTFDMKYVIGKTDKVYSGVGTFLSIVQSQWGFLFLILVPGFLIFIYEVYSLIVEIKYGNE